MKKLMFAAAIAAMAGSAFCIESANTVGYASKAVTAGTYYLIGVQFNDAASATKGSISMNSLIGLSSEITPGTYASDFADTPEILVLKASGGYEKYYYISDATDDNDDELGYDCWADSDGYELKVADNLVLGKGFWFKSHTSGTLNCAGQVSALSSFERNIPAGQFEIVANPYPVALNLNAPTISGITPGTIGDFSDPTWNNAPMIQVLQANGQGYDFYYYIDDADDGNGNYTATEWVNAEGFNSTGAQVGVGAAFWIKSATAGTFTFGL